MAVQTYPAKVLLFIAEEQPIVDAGYDVIAIERRKKPTDAFTEITKAATRLPIVVGTYNYFYLDEESEPGWEYRAVLLDDAAVLPPVPQPPTTPVDARYEYVCTIQELKDIYLYGLDDALSNDAGVPIPDYVYAHYIRSAIAKFEQKTSTRVTPTYFEEHHDYFQEDAETFYSFWTDEFPVIQVQSIELTLPGATAQAFPEEWLRLEKLPGQIHMIPGPGPTPFTGLRNRLISGLRSNKFLPQAFLIKYFAGFGPGELPANIKNIIGLEASYGPLNIGGDLLGGAGIASQTISLDGLSTTFNTTSSSTSAGFGARIIQYTKELKDQYPEVTRYFKGLRMRVV
jgi:hypothetical protein